MSSRKKNVERLSYTSEGNITTYRGRIFRYLNGLTPQEKRAKIYEALEKYFLPEAMENEGWRERENKKAKIVECAEGLKIKAKSIYKMIEEESDEDEDEDERKIKYKKKRKKSDKRNEEEIDDEEDEDEDKNNKGTKKMKGFDMNDPNVWIPERDGKEDTGALQELLDSI